MVSVKVLGDKALIRQLSILRTLVKSFKKPLKDISKQVYQENASVFNSEGSFGGRKKWKQLKEPYRSRKQTIAPGKKILELTGKLKAQATSNQGVFKLTDDTLEVGVNLPHAGVHQFGFNKTAARPYLTVTKKQEKIHEKIIDAFVLKQAKAAGFRAVGIFA